MKRSLWGWILVCILSSVTLSFAQIATTSLRGTIKDPSGALVPGAKVTLTDKSNGTTLTAVANNAGSYVFAQITPAKYTITVSASGFGDQTKSAELLVNQPATIDFSMTVQSSSVTVDVTAEAQTLNTSDATIGNSVGNATIEALPMEGRDPLSLLSLQPGVLYIGEQNTVADSRQGAVAGGRSDQGNVTLDGVDDNDQIQGTAFTGVLRSTLDSTEEFRVTTSNGTADSGRSSGAQISLITKTGSNKYHGSLYEYYRPTNTVANDWFNKATEIGSGEPNVPQKYVLNTFGGSFGGPIKKDKLFYFFNYEGQRKAIDQIVTATVPTASFMGSGSNSATGPSLGYVNAAGTTEYLNPSQFATLDSGCSTNLPCGVNPNVIQYYSTVPVANGPATTGDGINSGSLIFSSPYPSSLNTSIFKLDYNLSSKQHIFARGNLQKDTQAGLENLPGQPPQTTHEDNTKGLAFGHTWTPTSSIVNDLRYGFIRQGYSTQGIGDGSYVFFRFYTQPTAQNRSTIVNVPVHNVIDTFTLTKGTHTISVGANWRHIQNNRGTDSNSYSGDSTNPYWLGDNPAQPADGVSSGFANSYSIAYATLVGTVPSLTSQYNYAINKGQGTATLLANGAFIKRSFEANEYEYYLQDSWRIKPNLTITYGVRHTILQTPYEVNGQQVSPTVDTDAWFKHRGTAAAQGQVFEDLLTFAPSGKANNAPGYWPHQKLNFAPRLSAVYSPDTKTSIRVGAGMYFDHFGEGIVDAFDQEGSFGLTTSVTNPASSYTFEDSPRFTFSGPGVPNVIPNSACTYPSSVKYPFTPFSDSACGFAITWGIDNHLKTPYSESFDFSIQRELPSGFLFETAYVGRLGRHLLQQLDLAEPVNYVDPQGGGDYFTAGSALSKLSDQNGGNSAATVQPIQYFEDIFPFAANLDYNGESATQAIYSDFWAPFRYSYGETTSLDILDFGGFNSNGPLFWQPQFSSLYSWATIGQSSYNALQFTLRHPTMHGLTADVSYTFAKSLDMNSGTERVNELTSTDENANSDNNFSGSAIQNSWNPKLNKAVSDFDTHSLITADWVYALPIGRGKSVLGSANLLTETLLGGWQWAGLGRWTSGLPFAFTEPGWSTNWQLEGWGVKTAPFSVHKNVTGGIPQAFTSSTISAINSGVYNGTPERLPYPGEAGQRNNFRGDGYFDVDSSLSKSWKLAEETKLKFAWEVYNVSNSVRFDDSPLNLNAGLTSGTLGAYGATLTTYRRMQFGLRLDF